MTVDSVMTHTCLKVLGVRVGAVISAGPVLTPVPGQISVFSDPSGHAVSLHPVVIITNRPSSEYGSEPLWLRYYLKSDFQRSLVNVRQTFRLSGTSLVAFSSRS